MAKMIVTFKIMPESIETDLSKIEEKAKEVITKYGEWKDSQTIPIAFGLKALHIIFAVDENENIDKIEEEVSKIENVQSVETIGMSRALEEKDIEKFK